VDNTTLRLRPGMTATASIITKARANVLLVPNAALRFKPATAAASSTIASAIVPTRSRRSDTQSQTATRGKGARQTLYVLKDGVASPVTVQTGATDGSLTEVVSGALAPGMLIITGQLASGKN